MANVIEAARDRTEIPSVPVSESNRHIRVFSNASGGVCVQTFTTHEDGREYSYDYAIMRRDDAYTFAMQFLDAVHDAFNRALPEG